MPEGHTIHRLARDHRRWFAGESVQVSSPQGRFEAGAALLDGEVLLGTDAHGKHLFHHYPGGSVHIHLGLFGRFRHHRGAPPEPTDTVRYRVTTAEHTIDLVGPNVCELLSEGQVEQVRSKLGPDPLRADADPAQGLAALGRRRIPIGRALLDQGVLSGVGNVYRAEVLFIHGMHPETPSADITPEQWASMWSTLSTWLEQGVRERRIITVDPDEVGAPRSRIPRREATYVYHQQRCRRCGDEVRRWDLAGRWAYACETCQPPPSG